MRILIIDLEATCWENASREQRNDMETIEIGCAVVEPYTMKLLHEIDIIVKPAFHPKLTNFCTELTSITQEMVDELDGLYGKVNPAESFYTLRDAWHVIRGYVQGDK